MSLAARIRILTGTIHHLRLLAIATSVKNCAFSAVELLAHARLDADLRYVLNEATTPKQVGRRLVELARHPAGGLRLVRVDRDECGCIWSVEIQDAAGLSPDAAVKYGDGTLE